jgi:hypothetical protein
MNCRGKIIPFPPLRHFEIFERHSCSESRNEASELAQPLESRDVLESRETKSEESVGLVGTVGIEPTNVSLRTSSSIDEFAPL